MLPLIFFEGHPDDGDFYVKVMMDETTNKLIQIDYSNTTPRPVEIRIKNPPYNEVVSIINPNSSGNINLAIQIQCVFDGQANIWLPPENLTFEVRTKESGPMIV